MICIFTAYSIKKNEDRENYILRIISKKKEIGTWDNIADICNHWLKENRTESYYRKKYGKGTKNTVHKTVNIKPKKVETKTTVTINADKSENPYHFCINTGDATQNGNRINEWLDYFEAGKEIFKDTEQMYVVGNNDLSPLDPKILGVGDDLSKINPINVNYFFTFELPFDIPTSYSGVFIPSVYSFIYGNTYFLAMNSEVTEIAREDIYSDPDGINVYTNQLLTWCTNDLLNHSTDSNVK